MAGRIDGTALGAVAAGAVFSYAALKGKSVLALVQGMVQGIPPVQVPAANQIPDTTAALQDTGSPGGSTPGASPGASTSAIVSAALRYAGAGYLWGGTPALGTGVWDCSSFANWVIGHDVRRAIPGYAAGSYDGKAHGPSTLVWLAWSGCTTVGTDPAAAQPGDLAIWLTHMGICLGGGQMISALNPSLGTRVTWISGGAPPGEPLHIRRLT